MSIPKKPFTLTRNLFRRIRKLYDVTVKALANSVLRTLQRRGRRPYRVNAGFALPTTIMVLLVVILLTTAMVFRSFDRNRNAILSRSEQVIQNTSTPALDRARAKIAELLADPNLPRGTPPDTTLLQVVTDAKYTFNDETRLKLAFDLDKNGSIASVSTDNTLDPKLDETLNTAWKYPVDTDGNGKFDAFTLYGIYWRSPNLGTGGQSNQYARGRTPLEARSLPQDSAGLSGACKSAGLSAATSIAQGDWLIQGSNLSKAFYVYAATVPITSLNGAEFSPGPFPSNQQFEINKRKDKAFSGLEYEQDRYRQGLNNNAVLYQNDLIMNPGGTFRLNGKIVSNSNLLVGGPTSNIQLFQVSSIYSCFYEEENGLITVGGNVGTGEVSQSTDQQPTKVDLFQGKEIQTKQVSISGQNRSTNSPGGSKIAYNDAAYTKRIGLMKQTALSFCNCDGDTKKPTSQSLASIPQYTNDPAFQKSLQEALAKDSGVNNPYDILAKQIEIYLRNRTRGVPYAEVPEVDAATALDAFVPNAQGINTSVFSQGIEPPDVWSTPSDANTKLSLDTNNLPQNNPSKRQNNPIENQLGDRVNVGNNLPAYWKQNGKYVGAEGKQDISGANWADDNTARYRTTQVQPIDDLGETDRGGYWEKAAALNPNPPKNSNAPSNAGGGGLRVITGAGIYVDGDTPTTTGAAYPRLVAPAGPFRDAQTSFLPVPYWDTRFVDPNGTDPNRIHPADLQFNAQPNILVWSDLMPMTGGIISGSTPPQAETRNGDLLMRATAVYHYVDGATASPNISQTPIACVSSYYNPTDKDTARNLNRLSSDVSGGLDTNGDGPIDTLFDNSPAGSTPPGAKSNNGVVYEYPGRQLGRYQATLMRQASLVFPNGRVVNPPLREAMRKRLASEPLTLADYSAIDTAICAIAILENKAGRSTVIPDGAIKESAFLDGREVKEVDRLTPNNPNYDSTKLSNNLDLPLELRQPLEIRVTDINLGLLAKTKHSQFDTNGDGKPEQEYLLPNSGIIYASRDDAFSDSSDSSAQGDLYSPIDFKLDPTRRPNGIRLINGLSLERERNYRVEEKGLILATNLPSYVKGHFNLHLQSGTTTFTSGNKELEEFQETLDTTAWGNFYSRGSNPNDVEKKFACRYDPAQPRKCPSPGDQWRPATIIADAVTLQSGTFKDGYRNQGDFDLRNNVGGAASIPDPATPTVINTVAGNRANNGFFDNNFVTTANWWQNTGFPKGNTQVSYLLNGVTPIQRRANVYAYTTETCRVIPVSQCTANDWTPDPSTLDTSTATSVVGDQRYARRVAFVRDQTKGSYYYDPDGYPQLKNNAPTVKQNALWFAMRDNSGQLTYQAAAYPKPFIFQPLYPADYPVARLRNQPQIPDLKWLRGYAAASPTQLGFLKTNLGPVKPSSGTPAPVTASAFTPPNSSQDFTTVQSIFTYIFNTQFGAFSFPATKRFNIALGTNQPYLNFGVEDPNNRTVDLTGGGKMRVFSANSLSPTNSSPLILTGDAGSVFVIHVKGALTLQGKNAVQLKGGVVPDNIYWLVEGSVSVSSLGILPGNVLAKGTIIVDKSQIEGRALSLTPGGVQLQTATSRIIPPAGNQPRLVPVNQIQSSNGTPAISTTTPRPGDDTKYSENWLQQAESTNYNAAFVVGDSPTRPDEQSAGLNNLVRLQESWAGKTLTIKGSFIESKRSSTATGPFSPIRRSVAGQASPAGVNPLSIFDPNTQNRYWTDSGTPRGTLPYYSGATRQWGFDVGLLSQSPDLFSQRFTKDIPRSGNYYRQVGRDDSWIETLLCAAEPANPTNIAERVGAAGTNYTRPAVPASERPDCKNVTNISTFQYPPN